MTNFTKGFFKQFSKKSEVVPSRKHYDSPVPLSFAQQRLWFLDQLLPNQPFYNAPLAFEVQGHLRVDVLIHSLTEICRRHEVLRTTFAPIEGRPLQVIHPPSRFCLLCIDMSQLTSQELEREAERVVNQEVVSPFDLARGPLLRAILLRLASDRHQFVFTMHHVVADRWARRVFIQELATLYTAYLRGESSPLEELPLQYADFALWQRQRLQGEVLERQLAYWREQLAGAPQVLELPMALPRPAVQTFRGATYPFTLSPALCADLRRVSRQEGVTLFMVLLATFQTLLLHYTGQPDLLVGTPIANRRYSELEGLIGFFANTLVLRTNLSGDPSFRDALKRVRDVCLGAYAHQDLPFEHLVEAMQAQRDMSYNPLIQVLFVFQNISDTSLKLEGLGVKPLSLKWQQAKFDLSLEIENTSPELVGVVEYSTDLFEVSSIHRFVQHFQRLLEGVIADPMRRLSDLPLLTQKERDQLLVDWNTTQRVYRQECCIQQLFEEQVVRTPEAVAVVFGELLLTYGILNEYANQLAHHLRRQGVAPEVLVGIYMERSLGMIVGLLGILKAGGAYLPLDPASPQERLAFMLQNAQVEIVVTQQRYVMEMSEREIQLVVLDSDWRKIAQESDENPGCDAIPENLAYVIYTSGSTGRSKGVMVTHASLANAYWGWEEAYQLRALLRCHLQMANFSFDVFTGDVVRALCSGAKLVFCTQEILLSPDKLYALMLREMVDVGEFVPVVLGNLVQYLQVSQQSLEYMKLLVVGSDSWYGRDQEALQSVCPPGTRLVNSYGITETTIDSTYFEGVEQVQFADRLVPIGRPFANIQVYVLNEVLRPTPIGVVGELYIGGAGLARGYFNHPMLTAERFLPHSLSSKPGARIYKTGDLARYREDGTIEFLGRKDKQIKLRGYRIELGEIEAILEQYPLVREAIVLLREEAPGERQLVAYLLPRGEEQPDNKELRMHLQRFLPHYMLPNAFVLLHAWPLTASGKVDRLRLPAPNLSHRVVPEMLVAPRTPIEELLVEIWQQVLRIERVGIFDNFFDLGGHSLLATQVISRICSAFQMDFPLRALFEAPTIIGLAQRLEQSLNIPQQVPALPLHSYARPN
ncbi:MAG TPA: amino acid adenylation domain-containing protein, partial [Ktedonobacteraceae bacterium]|nr:amino acid adenylation domain-containing protein [Ktedonobacteraceae bacterium]